MAIAVRISEKLVGEAKRFGRIDHRSLAGQIEHWALMIDKKMDNERGKFFAFSRKAYGIVKTRTDGGRMLVYTDSGKADMKEAYSYTLNENGLPIPSPVVRV